MISPRRNPFTRSATVILALVAFAWVVALALFLAGVGDVPDYLVLAGPLAGVTLGFFLWVGWVLLATAYYRVRARFAQQRPRKR